MLGVISAAVSSVSLAAEDPYTDYPYLHFCKSKVFTPSRQNQNLRDSPAAIIVIAQQQIKQRGYRNRIDLLEMLPGFDIQRRSESNRVNDVTMRGQFKHRHFLIMQDGVQIDSPDDDILALADNYPLFHAKQVEVVYEPNSALWGN